MKSTSSNIFEKGYDAIKNMWSPTAEKIKNSDEKSTEETFDEDVKITSQIGLQG
jgi:hypothetical protein